MNNIDIRYTVTAITTSADAALRKDRQIRRSALETQSVVRRSEQQTRTESTKTTGVIKVEGEAYEKLGNKAVGIVPKYNIASRAQKQAAREAGLTALALHAEGRSWDELGDQAFQAGVKVRASNAIMGGSKRHFDSFATSAKTAARGAKDLAAAAGDAGYGVEQLATRLGGGGGRGGGRNLRQSIFDANMGFRFFSNTISLIKWPAMISFVGLAVQAISALAAGAVALTTSLASASGAIISLTSALAPASGALIAYPAIIGAVVQSIGTLTLAFGGLKEAMQAQATGMSAVAQAQLQMQSSTLGVAAAQKAQRQALIQSGASSLEYREATMGVTQAQAQAIQSEKALRDARMKSNAEVERFAKFLDEEAKPKLIELQGVAAKGLLPGLTSGARELLGGRLFDTIRGGVEKQAQTLGNIIAKSASQFNKKGFTSDIATIFAANTQATSGFAKGLIGLSHALTDVLVAATPMIRWFGSLAQRFGQWAQESARAGRETGKLQDYFRRSQQTLTTLGRIIGNVGHALINTFAAGRKQGETMLQGIERITRKWREWTESVMGRNRLDRFFERSARSAATWGRMIRDFGVALINIFKGSADAGRTLSEELADAAANFRKWTETAKGQNQIREFFDRALPPLEAMGRLISAVTKAFLRLGQDPGLANFIDLITTKLVPSLERLISETNKAFGPALAKTLASLAQLVGDLAGANGPLTLFIKTIGVFIDAIDRLINVIPGFRTAIFNFVGAMAILKASLAVGKFGSAALGTSILGRVFGRGGAAAEATTEVLAARGAAAAGARTGPAPRPNVFAPGGAFAGIPAGFLGANPRPPIRPGGIGGTLASNLPLWDVLYASPPQTLRGEIQRRTRLFGRELSAGLQKARESVARGFAGTQTRVQQFGASRTARFGAVGLGAAGIGAAIAAPEGSKLARVGGAVAQGALIGGTLGSFAGPEGTAIGALAGGLVGAGIALKSFTKAVDEAREATKRSIDNINQRIRDLQSRARDVRPAIRDARLNLQSAAVNRTQARQNLARTVAAGGSATDIRIARLNVEIAEDSFRKARKELRLLQKELTGIQKAVERKSKIGLAGQFEELVKGSERASAKIKTFFGDIQLGSGKQVGFASLLKQLDDVEAKTKHQTPGFKRMALAVREVANEAQAMGRKLTAKEFNLLVKAKLDDKDFQNRLRGILAPKSLKVQLEVAISERNRILLEGGAGPHATLLQRANERDQARLDQINRTSQAGQAFAKQRTHLEDLLTNASATPQIQDDIKILNKLIALLKARRAKTKGEEHQIINDALQDYISQRNDYVTTLQEDQQQVAADTAAAAADAAAAAKAAADAKALARPVFKKGQIRSFGINQLIAQEVRLRKLINEAQKDGVTHAERIDITRWQRALKLLDERLERLLARQATILEKLAAQAQNARNKMENFFRKLGVDTGGLVGVSLDFAQATIDLINQQKILNKLLAQRAKLQGDANRARRRQLTTQINAVRQTIAQDRADIAAAQRSRAERMADLRLQRLEIQQRIAGTADTPGGRAARGAALLASTKPMEAAVAKLQAAQKKEQELARTADTKKERQRHRAQAQAIADAIFEKTIAIEERQAEALELIRDNTDQIQKNTGQLSFEFQGQRFTDLSAFGVGV